MHLPHLSFNRHIHLCELEFIGGQIKGRGLLGMDKIHGIRSKYNKKRGIRIIAAQSIDFEPI